MVANPVTATANSELASLHVHRLALEQVFTTINSESCPQSYNFHLHTTCSDGQLWPDELIQQAIAHQLKGLAITDHHSIDGYRIARQWLTYQHAQAATTGTSWVAPLLWSGVEISADLLGTEVHILCYAFDPDHPALTPYLQGHTPTGDAYAAAQVIHAVHTAGGLAVLAHPVRYRRSPAHLIAEAARLGMDGVETYYAYDNPKPWRTSPKQTADVIALANQYNLFSTCGTDTHGMSILSRI